MNSYFLDRSGFLVLTQIQNRFWSLLASKLGNRKFVYPEDVRFHTWNLLLNDHNHGIDWLSQNNTIHVSSLLIGAFQPLLLSVLLLLNLAQFVGF